MCLLPPPLGWSPERRSMEQVSPFPRLCSWCDSEKAIPNLKNPATLCPRCGAPQPPGAAIKRKDEERLYRGPHA